MVVTERHALRITTPATEVVRAAVDALVIAVPRTVELQGSAASLDDALGGRLARLAERGELRGNRNHVSVLHTDGSAIRAGHVITVGLGRDPGPDEVRGAVGVATRAAMGVRARTLAVDTSSLPLEREAATRCAVDGVVLGGYRFDRYRTTGADNRPQPLRSVAVLGGSRAAAQRAAVAAVATNRARDLQNTPSNQLGPAELAARAREIGREHTAVTVQVHDQRWLRSRGMGAFLAVAQASPDARMIVLRHRPRRARRALTLGLVGKGITFDSGGLNLKPGRSLAGMKYDMSGAAAVIEATAAIAALGLPIDVITVAGATENLLDRDSYKLDDVITAGNGKTIEITNTDAEGRLVLADCIHHARTLGATHIVDLATLTGAVRVALGDVHAGMLGRDQEFLDQIREAGERSGDHVWQLPLFDGLRRFIRSDVADMINASAQGLAGPCYPARFLQEFAGEGAWAHLDIAGVADLQRPRGDEFTKGGTGFGVRLLVELAESLC